MQPGWENWEKHHGTATEAPKVDLEPSSEHAPKKAKITGHLDHAYTKEEQDRALRRLIFAAIYNGWSHNSLQQQPFKLFCKALRYAFVLLSMGLIYYYVFQVRL